MVEICVSLNPRGEETKNEDKNSILCQTCNKTVPVNSILEHKGHTFDQNKLSQLFSHVTEEWRTALIGIKSIYESSELILKESEKIKESLQPHSKDEIIKKEIKQAEEKLHEIVSNKALAGKLVAGKLDETVKQIKELDSKIKKENENLKEQEKYLEVSNESIEQLLKLAMIEDIGLACKDEEKLIKEGEHLGKEISQVEEMVNESNYYPLGLIKELMKVMMTAGSSKFANWITPYFKKLELPPEEGKRDRGEREGEVIKLFTCIAKAVVGEVPNEVLAVLKMIISGACLLCGLKLGDKNILDFLCALKPLERDIKSLILDSCGLTEAFAQGFKENCKNEIMHLSLADNPGIGMKGLETLVTLMSDAGNYLTYLDLSHMQMNEKTLSMLGMVGGGDLQTLVLNNCKIDANGMKYLSSGFKHGKIKALFLNDNPIGDEAMKPVAMLIVQRKLRAVSLANTGITEKFIKEIIFPINEDGTKEEKPNELRPEFMCFDRNNIGDNGVEILAKGLTDNCDGLMLRDCGITDDGMTRFIDNLREGAEIRALWLNGNKITDKTCDLLTKLMKTMNLLSLDRTQITGAGISMLAEKLDKKREMDDDDEIFNNDGDYRGFNKDQGFCFSFESCNLSGKDVLPLFHAAGRRTIRALNLTNNNIGDEGLMEIARIMTISEFIPVHLFMINNGFTSNGIIDFCNKMCKATSKNKIIRTCYIDENCLDNSCAAALENFEVAYKVQMLSAEKESKINIDAMLIFSNHCDNTWTLSRSIQIPVIKTAMEIANDPLRKERKKIYASGVTIKKAIKPQVIHMD